MHHIMQVIGAGRIGLALKARAPEAVELIDRSGGSQAFEGDSGLPIVCAVRNDDLGEVLARVPDHRRNDLVFIQNGMLRPWLAEQGLEGATRGLIFFAVSKKGAPIEVGGASLFFGPHAEKVVRQLRVWSIDSKVVSDSEFKSAELEKLIWNSVFGLMCEAKQSSVGEIVMQYGAELRELVDELRVIGSAELGIQLNPDKLHASLCEYSLSIASYRGAVKEWKWRNGWFVDVAKARAIESPIHQGWLSKVGR